MGNCDQCGAEVMLPFECNFCGGNFCMEHRLPENHNCVGSPARTPLGHWRAKKPSAEDLPKGKEVEVIVSEGDLHFEKKRLQAYNTARPVKIGEKEHSKDGRQKRLKAHDSARPTRIGEKPAKFRRSFNVNWRPRKLLMSLKLWFPVFLVIVALMLLMEGNNPTKFYQSTPDFMKYGLFVFVSVIGVWSGYRIFDKCDYNPHSDRGLFGLKLLSGGILVLSFFMLVSGFSLMGDFFFIQPQLSLGREIFSVFLIVLSLVLMVTSAYLIFKFERRSGIIVYRR